MVPVPVIASGGMGKPEDFQRAVCEGHADAVAAASILHYGKYSVQEIKKVAEQSGINIRSVSEDNL